MLKELSRVGAIAIALMVAACSPPPSKGTVTIITEIDFSAEPFYGTFEVTDGAEVLGCSRGSFTDTPLGADVEKLLTCESGSRSGSFTVEFTPQYIPGPGDQNGPWTVVAGTQEFRGLTGGGDFSVIYEGGTESGVETLTGDIDYSP